MQKWHSVNDKPRGESRRLLVCINNPHRYPEKPEINIAYWKSTAEIFIFEKYEPADHLIEYWCDFPTAPDPKFNA